MGTTTMQRARNVLRGGLALLIAALALFQAGDTVDQIRNVQFAVFLAGLGVVSLRLAQEAGSGAVLSRPVWTAVGLCAVSGAISLSQSPAPAVAASRASVYVALAVVAVAVLAAHARVAWSLVHWLTIVAGLGLAMVIWAFVDLANPPSGHDWELLLYGAFPNIRHLGTMAFIAATAATALFVVRPRWTLLAWLAATASLTLIVGSGSRAALLGWLVFTAALVVLVRQRVRVIALTGSGLVAGSITSLLLQDAGLLPTSSIFSRLEAMPDEIGLDGLSSGRIEIWTLALRRMLEDPLFGLGPDGYRLSQCCVTEVDYPHNAAVQALMEFGFVGALAFLGLVITAVFRFGGVRRVAAGALVTSENRVLTAMLIGFAPMALLDGTGNQLLPMLHATVYLSLWCAALRNPAGDSQQGPPGTTVQPWRTVAAGTSVSGPSV